MRVEWDWQKNETNLAKHGVDFETAQLVFEDPCCVTFVERAVDGEEQWHAIVVVHTYREEGIDPVVRLISARPATKRERKLYAQAIG